MDIPSELQSAIHDAIKPKDVVIVAPLNWGLGHASRSIVIIEYLRHYVAKVVLVSDGISGLLLQKEFPDLPFYNLESPEIRYGSTSMIVNGVCNAVSIINHIRIDKIAANDIVSKERATVIISDNRFGFRDDRCTNIYLTHQLNINTGNILFSSIISRWHRNIIDRFDACWVPDFDDEKRCIAGMLSRKSNNINITYIGSLSRVYRLDLDRSIDLLILLSGPEPQRSMFEKSIILSLNGYKGQVELIRGTQNLLAASIPDHWNVINIASSQQINRAINTTKRIICRSGYSTLMDLASYKGRLLLVPTPGQGEQEYLANFHFSKGTCTLIAQSQITENNLSVLLAL